jgi:dTDP-4-amino-4,6-dideoxygalactose transaminase
VQCPVWDQAKPEAHVFHVYTVRTSKRDALVEHLKSNGVAAQLHYPTPVHLQEGYARLGFSLGDLPASEKVASEILSLPMYPELDLEKIGYVAQQIQAFFRN